MCRANRVFFFISENWIPLSGVIFLSAAGLAICKSGLYYPIKRTDFVNGISSRDLASPPQRAVQRIFEGKHRAYTAVAKKKI